jgi:hypothetical protein
LTPIANKLDSTFAQPRRAKHIINLNPNGITIHHLTSFHLIPSAFGRERIITEQLEGGGKLVSTNKVGSTC